MAQFSPMGVPLPTPKPAQGGVTPTATEADPQTDLRSGWQTFLADPANRAGLLQFGLSMLAGDPENTLGQNLGNAIGQGFATRGAVQEGEAAAALSERKEGRADALAESTIAKNRAYAQKARRGPAAKAASTAGQMTPKDYAKEWIKFVKDARKNEDERTIAELRTEFDEMWAAGTSPPGAAPTAPPAPATSIAGTQAAAINQMTLEQIQELSKTKLTPADAAAALARYKQLKAEQ
jgi:hypothetical protein